MAKKKNGGPTKADAVRQALKEGVESPQDGVAYVKEKFGLEITAQQFSTYKSIERKKANGSNGVGSRKAPARRSGRLPVPAPITGSISDDLTALKEMVKRYGADEVISLVSLVG